MLIAYVNNFVCREESPLKSSKLESKTVACDVSDRGTKAGSAQIPSFISKSLIFINLKLVTVYELLIIQFL